jgi:hypothetical protein
MGPLDGLHVEVDGLLFRVLSDGGIARVRQRAGLPVAEAGDIILVAAEILLLVCSATGSFVSKADVREVYTKMDKTNFNLNEQNCWLMTCQMISSDAMIAVLGARVVLCSDRLSARVWLYCCLGFLWAVGVCPEIFLAREERDRAAAGRDKTVGRALIDIPEDQPPISTRLPP